MQAPAILPNLPVPAGSDIVRIFLLHPAGFLSFDISIWVLSVPIWPIRPLLLCVCPSVLAGPVHPSQPSSPGGVRYRQNLFATPAGFLSFDISIWFLSVSIWSVRPLLLCVCVSIWSVRPLLLCVSI